MFNMTSDSGLFRTREQLIAEGWKLESNLILQEAVNDTCRYMRPSCSTSTTTGSLLSRDVDQKALTREGMPVTRPQREKAR